MGKALIYKQILLTNILQEMHGDQSGEFVFGYWGLRGYLNANIFTTVYNIFIPGTCLLKGTNLSHQEPRHKPVPGVQIVGSGAK